MSAAVTTRRIGTPPSTFTRPATRSSRVMIRPKAGAGAIWTRPSSTYPIGPPRRTDRSLATSKFRARCSLFRLLVRIDQLAGFIFAGRHHHLGRDVLELIDRVALDVL